MSPNTHDIFLSYAPADAGTAAVVERAMSTAGLSVFRASDITVGTQISGAVLEALIESKAVIAVMTPLSAKSQNIAFELGMAMSWRKPVYLLLDSVNPEELFTGARRFHQHSLSDLSSVVAAVKRHAGPLTEGDRQRLIRLYNEFQMPTDRLLTNPGALDELATRLKEAGGREFSGERLAGELLRLRKSGKLPRLRHSNRTRESSKGAA
jgi:hypothetical protein